MTNSGKPGGERLSMGFNILAKFDKKKWAKWKLKSEIKRIKGQSGSEVKSNWKDILAHKETKRMKQTENMYGVRRCSLWLSYSLALLLCHRQRLCTHNSGWFRAAIERSEIISSIICRKMWLDWISIILVFAAGIGLTFSLSFSAQSQFLWVLLN